MRENIIEKKNFTKYNIYDNVLLFKILKGSVTTFKC